MMRITERALSKYVLVLQTCCIRPTLRDKIVKEIEVKLPRIFQDPDEFKGMRRMRRKRPEKLKQNASLTEIDFDVTVKSLRRLHSTKVQQKLRLKLQRVNPSFLTTLSPNFHLCNTTIWFCLQIAN